MPTLARGERLGPYEILGAIGAGGMGEVYRAHDTKLGRDVAVKVLPESFAHDAERMARFEREAQVLASLNHPHIATIHGLEESSGVRALVMELVEGPTLAERISSRAMLLDEALPIAKQIADGLEYAHERGIIHRDLKPANVKLTADGNVKILDFGLAKALETPTPQGNPSISPTLTLEGTRAGVILGTAAYMAPEQARGAVVDKRADIWAFGVVLYEMLTGKQPFAGETVSDTLAAVLRAEPQWDAIPVGMRRLVRRCLEKNPKLRLRDIGDAMPLLDEVAELKPASPGERRARWLWPCISALAVLAGASLAVVDWQRKAPQREMIAFNIEAPAGQHIQNARVSPDGKQMSLVVGLSSRGGTGRMLIRSMDSPALRPVPGTEDISADPYWSPDSRKIAFQQGGQIKTVDLTTGSIQILCRAERIQLSDWGANGVILFSAATSGNLQVFQVPAAGGSPRVIMPLDDTRKESSQTAAQFLPDGKRFMYYSQGQMNEGTYVVSLDGKFRQLLKSGPGIGFYLRHPRTGKSYLLLFDPTTWLAQRFDTSTLQLMGDPVIVRQVPAFTRALTATPQGLVYSASPGAMARNKLAWYSRAGKELDVVSEGNAIYSHELSPDNGQVAWELLTEPYAFGDIWVKDLVRGAKIRLTSDSGWEFTQRFWPDGSKIAFMWYRDQPRRLHIAIKPANGTGSEELVLESPILLYLDDVSPDGAFLLYDQDGPPTTLWVLPMKGDRRPILFRRGQADSLDGRFSPDGRWIAYTSSDSGRNEIQVQDFVPEAGVNQRTRGALTVVSTDGGRFPRWSRDGKELFYLAPDNSLMVVPVKTADKFTVGRPEKLFRLPGLPSRYRIPYAVAADSRRFLIAAPENAGTEDPVVITGRGRSAAQRAALCYAHRERAQSHG